MQNCTNSPEDQAASVCPPPPQFPGDDTRPTSKKELAGWYSYGWAAEVFTVCAMGMHILHRPRSTILTPPNLI